MRCLPPLALALVFAAPSAATAAAPPVTDTFARGTTRAMLADRLSIGSTNVNLFDFTCRRVSVTTVACEWSFGANGGPLDAYGEGTIETLAPPSPGSAPRYRYDYHGEIARRASRDPLRYRVRAFHWRYTSPSHAAFLRGVADRFQRRADDQFTAWEDRSGATGSPVSVARPCVWVLNEDRTISGTCTATYNAQTAGPQPRACRVVASAVWAVGSFATEGLDTRDCDGAPG